MADGGTAKPQEPAQDDDTTTEAVLSILAVGAALDATAAALAAVLAVPVAVVLALLRGIGAVALAPFTRAGADAGRGGASAVSITDAANLRYRAAFIHNAVRRIAAAPDKKTALKRELGFWKAHIAAGNRRRLMGKRVDVARKRYGDLLGWYAKMDSRTSAECRAADGRNFLALTPPVIGYPGGVHPHCRCLPGPPFEGAKMVDQSLTVRRSDAASGFHRRSAS